MNGRTRKTMIALGAVLGLMILLTITSTRAQVELQDGATLQANPGTGFTYQGRLTNGGTPVNGTCDFEFKLYDAANAGTQIGSTQTKTNVSVGAGYFTIPDLDFGAGAFDGQARWLAIGVKCPTGSSGSYTALNPRQPLTPVPYALALPGLYTQQTAGTSNLIGGYHGNSVTGGVVGATIGGGGINGFVQRVTDNYGTVGGGSNNQAGDGAGTTNDREYATVAGGGANIASGNSATVGGGFQNTAGGDYATVPGGFRANASHYGEMAYASGWFNSAGDAQTSVYVMRNLSPNDGSFVDLFLDGVAQRLTIAQGRTIAFDAMIVGRDAGGNSAAYRIVGAMENEGGTTQYVGSPIVQLVVEDVVAWDVQVNADDPNDALTIRASSLGSQARWVAVVQTVEVQSP